MIKQLHQEAHAQPLDAASRHRLHNIHARSINELAAGLSPGPAHVRDRATRTDAPACVSARIRGMTDPSNLAPPNPGPSSAAADVSNGEALGHARWALPIPSRAWRPSGVVGMVMIWLKVGAGPLEPRPVAPASRHPASWTGELTLVCKADCRSGKR